MPLTPEDCRVKLQLRDGRQLHIRSIRPDDSAVLLAEFHRLSRSSVRSRFFSSKKELSAEELRYFTAVDFFHHVALVAEFHDRIDPQPAGVGRMIRTDEPGHAELALTVVEGMHGLGIGTELLKQLLRLAPLIGLRYLDAIVLEANRDMLDVLGHSGVVIDRHSDAGVVTVTLDIGEA